LVDSRIEPPLPIALVVSCDKIDMRILITLLFLFPVYNSEGQTRFVEGIVIESNTKSPLIGAIFYHSDSKTLGSTDFNGKFSIPLTNFGKTDLYVEYTGFECKVQAVDYNVEFIEVKLEEGQTIPPMRIIYPNCSNKPPLDSIILLCNRYRHEIDSIFSIENQTKK
jgi:carboxypeptidase-like protein